MTEFLRFTKKYYSFWLDIDSDEMNKKGIVLVESQKRNIRPKGYSNKFEIYAILQNDSLFISYSPEMNKKYKISKSFGNLHTVDKGIEKLEELLGTEIKKKKAYYFSELTRGIDVTRVVCLEEKNYLDYLTFFKKQNPSANPQGWLDQYFRTIVHKKRCYGIYVEDELVSVTGAGEMPFMEELVTEPSIDTLAYFRGKGFAKSVCAKYIQNAIKNREIPIWECNYDNEGSYKLAESLGFKWFADIIFV